MLFRFSLYGFLKNQRYFEPFLLLALLDKGLDYTQIGLLISVREITVLALEIPSGALADLFGRRGAMLVSFGSYIVSFLAFGFAIGMPALIVAMVLFGVGETFRSGTHKAMIFAWLQQQGREDERTAVYGYTRSWSKIGSAVSSIVAAAFLFASGRYEWVFFASVIPYTLELVNLASYPASIAGGVPAGGTLRDAAARFRDGLRRCLDRRRFGRLLLESMGFEGTFHAVKDYLQPVLQTAAVVGLAGLLPLPGWSATQRTAVLVGLVYVVLHLLSATASRRAGRVVEAGGGEERSAAWIWRGALGVFAVMLVAGYFDAVAWLIAGFVVLHVVQNVWRPILIGRIYAAAGGDAGATVLSVEGQARRVATMLAAPAVGLAVDRAADVPGGVYWPIGALGLLAALPFALKKATPRSE